MYQARTANGVQSLAPAHECNPTRKDQRGHRARRLRNTSVAPARRVFARPVQVHGFGLLIGCATLQPRAQFKPQTKADIECKAVCTGMYSNCRDAAMEKCIQFSGSRCGADNAPAIRDEMNQCISDEPECLQICANENGAPQVEETETNTADESQAEGCYKWQSDYEECIERNRLRDSRFARITGSCPPEPDL